MVTGKWQGCISLNFLNLKFIFFYWKTSQKKVHFNIYHSNFLVNGHKIEGTHKKRRKKKMFSLYTKMLAYKNFEEKSD